VLADRWRRTSPAGRLRVGLVNALAPLPVAFWLFTTDTLWIAYVLSVPLTLFTSLWIGPAASTVQDLVLPRMRGSASAAYLLVVTFIGLAMGPYTIGRLSSGLGDLRTGLLLSLVANLIAAVLLWRASASLPGDEQSLLERARNAGEPVHS
jgi:MFS family permease